LMFNDAGLDTVSTGYMYSTTLQVGPEVTRWAPEHEAWLIVDGYFRKPL